MFDAATTSPGAMPVAAVPKPGPTIHPAALAGALVLHLAGFGLLAWAAASREPRRAEEPAAIELTLESVATQAPETAASETQAPETSASDPEPESSPPEPPPPEPEPPPPPVEPPPPEPPPPTRPEAVAPPPAPRPRPPQPPRERRAAPTSSNVAPTAAPAPAAPVAPSGPPVVTNARFRRTPTPPDYPLVARERGITGAALIRALVGTDGETREVRLHRSSGHDILDSAALAAVRRWAFEPSSRDGQRIESWIEVPIRFQLR